MSTILERKGEFKFVKVGPRAWSHVTQFSNFAEIKQFMKHNGGLLFRAVLKELVLWVNIPLRHIGELHSCHHLLFQKGQNSNILPRKINKCGI